MNPLVSKTSYGLEQCYYQNVLYVVQEAKGLLSSLVLKTPLSKIPILKNALF